jgi:hypothetical protein
MTDREMLLINLDELATEATIAKEQAESAARKLNYISVRLRRLWTFFEQNDPDGKTKPKQEATG